MPTKSVTPEVEIKELIQSRQYAMTYEEKRSRLLPLLEQQVVNCCKSIPAYGDYLRKAGLPASGHSSYTDLPCLPVSVFKEFDLCAVPQDPQDGSIRSCPLTTPSRQALQKRTSISVGLFHPIMCLSKLSPFANKDRRADTRVHSDPGNQSEMVSGITDEQ
jgi:hypothetical protein